MHVTGGHRGVLGLTTVGASEKGSQGEGKGNTCDGEEGLLMTAPREDK